MRNQVDYPCFFFQAEDGIRGADVTGVQTCALPILEITPDPGSIADWQQRLELAVRARLEGGIEGGLEGRLLLRSEERRVGKEGRYVCGAGVVDGKDSTPLVELNRERVIEMAVCAG